MSTKPRGYFEYVLAVDVETSGMAFGVDDPSHNPATGETFQIVSIGLVVADVKTFTPIEELYLELKWDGKSTWSPQAQAVHGLTLEHLEEHGVTEEEAVEEIGNFIVKYWGLDSVICLLGHNVATFDKLFLQRLLRSQGLNFKFGNRVVDTNSIAQAAFGTFNSDDAFAAVGLGDRDPAKHNALDDAHCALTLAASVRGLFSQFIEPHLGG